MSGELSNFMVSSAELPARWIVTASYTNSQGQVRTVRLLYRTLGAQVLNRALQRLRPWTDVRNVSPRTVDVTWKAPLRAFVTTMVGQGDDRWREFIPILEQVDSAFMASSRADRLKITKLLIWLALDGSSIPSSLVEPTIGSVVLTNIPMPTPDSPPSFPSVASIEIPESAQGPSVPFQFGFPTDFDPYLLTTVGDTLGIYSPVIYQPNMSLPPIVTTYRGNTSRGSIASYQTPTWTTFDDRNTEPMEKSSTLSPSPSTTSLQTSVTTSWLIAGASVGLVAIAAWISWNKPPSRSPKR